MIEDYSFLYIFLFLPIISWLILKYIGLRDRRYYAVINFLLLATCLGFRGVNIGSDTHTYLNLFEHHANVGISGWIVDGFEWGYILLNKLLYFSEFPAQSILVVAAFVTIGITVYVFYTYSDKLWLSLYLFVGLGLYGYSFNIMRQTLAAAIVMLAVCLLSEGKRLWFVCLVLLGTTFHQSVMLFLPMVFLCNAKKSHIVGYIAVCVMTVLIIYGSGLEYFLFLIENSKYIGYMGSNRLGEVSFGFGLIKVFFNIALGFIGIGMYLKNMQRDKLLILSSLLVITAGVVDFLSYHMAMIGRFSYNYFLYDTILIPKLLKYRNLERNIYVLYFLIVAVVIWFTKYFMSIGHYI